MTSELCGEPANGGPCTMKKGHRLEYHRHRIYEKVYWEIKAGDKVLEVGNSRVPMNYAITRCFEEHADITITLQRYKSNDPTRGKV